MSLTRTENFELLCEQKGAGLTLRHTFYYDSDSINALKGTATIVIKRTKLI